MACVQFGVPFVTVATTSTLSTVAGAQTAAQQAAKLLGVNIGCDGTNSAQGPASVKLGTNTFAANAPGTNSTSVSGVKLDSGRPETVQTLGGKAWTTEPTVASYAEAFFVPVYMGSAIIFRPLTVPIIAKGGNGIVMSCQQQSGVTANVTGSLSIEE
jgi:hypothetical protein